MKKCLIILVIMGVIGCSSSATYIHGANGADQVSITCKRSPSNCFERAGEECPNGYTVINSGGAHSEFTYIDQHGGYSIPVYNGMLIVQCKEVVLNETTQFKK